MRFSTFAKAGMIGLEGRVRERCRGLARNLNIFVTPNLESLAERRRQHGGGASDGDRASRIQLVQEVTDGGYPLPNVWLLLRSAARDIPSWID